MNRIAPSSDGTPTESPALELFHSNSDQDSIRGAELPRKGGKRSSVNSAWEDDVEGLGNNFLRTPWVPPSLDLVHMFALQVNFHSHIF
jgi:hypothetical protein